MPLRVTTDQHPAYGKAIRWILGRKVRHRQSQYLKNRIEQASSETSAHGISAGSMKVGAVGAFAWVLVAIARLTCLHPLIGWPLNLPQGLSSHGRRSARWRAPSAVICCVSRGLAIGLR
jgi:hypothetical protein